ncbi:hypothetical protein Tco_1086835 [Tanacetum coccineum]
MNQIPSMKLITPSNNSDDENKAKIADKAEGDEDEEMYDTTNLLYDDISQVIEDAHVTLSTVAKKTEVPITSSFHSSNLAAKILNFLDIPNTDAKIDPPMDVHVHHEVPSQQIPTLLNNNLSTYDKVYLLKRSQKDKDKDEDLSDGSDRGLKKRKTGKDAKPTNEEHEFEVADSDMPQVQEENSGNDDEEPKGKTPQQRPTQSWLMTLASSAAKSSKIFDDLMSTPIDFFAYIMNGLHDVYSTKHILTVTQVDVMRKYGYGYIREIEVRRADNMNWLTNLSSDDVSDFAITLRMFTKSLVIQKRVEDLQLAVESYQKKINVTKPETTRSGIRKKDPYTPYQDPSKVSFIVDKETKGEIEGRRMMRSLEKFVGGRHNGTDLQLLQRTI